MNLSDSLSHVSDTALWVAVYRATESSKPDAVIVDPYARQLAGDRGFTLVSKIPKAMDSAWTVITRTYVFDRWILDLVKKNGISHVVNLAAGLDTRPYRLDLPAHLHWTEVDFPAVLQYKAQILSSQKSRCQLNSIGCDLSQAGEREAMVARIREMPGKLLLITEGLLVYLDPAEAESLADAIGNLANIHYWITDLNSPAGIQTMQKNWGTQLNQAKSAMRFAPKEREAFFTNRAWVVKEQRKNTDVGRQINRQMKHACYWRLIGKHFSKRMRERLKEPTKFLLLTRNR